MRYKKYLLIVLAVLFLTGCGYSEDNEKNESNIDNNKNEIEEVDLIKEKVQSMTIEEKIGQLFIVGFEGYEVDETVIDLVVNKNIGGVILFSRNISSAEQLVSLNNQLKDIEKKIPLFISVDEEGGLVSRVPEEFVPIPSSSVISTYSNNKEVAYDTGEIIAEELKLLGFNLDFAPVIDIYSNPNNTVIGERAFGDNADIVTSLGISLMNGLSENGIIPVVKHFPGHGDTDVDSHYGLPIVTKTKEELDSLEFIPFRQAIQEGVDAVMVSSILLENIDSNKPATMSEKVMTDILREEMGFEGVIITDDMTMGAILENYDLSEAVIDSINAGADLTLVCHGYENIINSINAVKIAVEENRISEDRVNESVYKILKLKEKYNINDKYENKEIDSKINEINIKINNIFYQ